MWDFQLIALEERVTPWGEDSAGWYYYSIANRISSVTGYRRGTKSEVMEFVHATVERLNQRFQRTRRPLE